MQITLRRPFAPAWIRFCATVGWSLCIAAGSLWAGESQLWRKISGTATDGQSVGDDYRISPDGRWVVFRRSPSAASGVAVYAVPLDGGVPPTRVSTLLPFGRDAGPFAITPDSSTIVYAADQEADDELDVYAVPISGGAVQRLSDASLPFGESVEQLEVGPLGNRVFYRSGSSLKSVAIDGSGDDLDLLRGQSLNPIVFLVSADGARVVFRAYGAGVDVFSTPAAGGALTVLSDAVAGAQTSTAPRISSDSQRVVFLSDTGVDDGLELYSIPIAGGAAVRLSDDLPEPLPFGSGGPGIESFRIDPTSARVVYAGYQDSLGKSELFSVPIGGGTVAKLSGPLVTGGNVSSVGYGIRSTGDRVVYLADAEQDGRLFMYSVPIDGGTAVKIDRSGDPPTSLSVVDWQLTPDGTTVVFRDVVLGIGIYNLWRTDITAASGDDPSNDLCDAPYDLAPDAWTLTASGKRIVKLSAIAPYEPTTCQVESSGDENVWTDPGEFVSGGAVLSFRVSRFGDIVYLADQEVDGLLELYSVPFLVHASDFESGGLGDWAP